MNLDIAFSDPTIARAHLAILVTALIVVLAGLHPRLRNSGAQLEKACNRILVGLGVLALLVYVNFHPFLPRQHHWDLFHYYIGSKYFSELGYTRLYACVAKAETENSNPAVMVAAYSRYIRDLGIDENQASSPTRLVPAKRYLFDDALCKAHFSAQRWGAFKDDVEYFRLKLDKQWGYSQTDRGFNASPAWMLAGGIISNWAPLSDSALMGITLIDFVFLMGSVICLAWAFGLRTTAVAIIVCTASIESWAFIGGSMLRFDWFFMAVLSICAMKRERYLLAGFALGYAAMLRLFPAVFALGPLIGLLYASYKRQHDFKMAYGKFFTGMIFSVAILAASSAALYGVSAHKGFIENTSRMSNTYADNMIGLRNVLTHAYEINMKRQGNADIDWDAAKIETRNKIMPIHFAIAAIALLFLIPAVISVRPWQAIAMGTLFVPFMWAELLNYYYLFLAIAGTLSSVNRKITFTLLGVGIASKVVWVSGMLNLELYFFVFSVFICVGALIVWWQANSQKLFWGQMLSFFYCKKNMM